MGSRAGRFLGTAGKIRHTINLSFSLNELEIERGLAWHGGARRGEAWRGKARQGKANILLEGTGNGDYNKESCIEGYYANYVRQVCGQQQRAVASDAKSLSGAGQQDSNTSCEQSVEFFVGTKHRISNSASAGQKSKDGSQGVSILREHFASRNSVYAGRPTIDDR